RARGLRNRGRPGARAALGAPPGPSPGLPRPAPRRHGLVAEAACGRTTAPPARAGRELEDRMHRRLIVGAIALLALLIPLTAVANASTKHRRAARAAAPRGAIKHVIVIDLENENFGDTFGAASPPPY